MLSYLLNNFLTIIKITFYYTLSYAKKQEKENINIC